MEVKLLDVVCFGIGIPCFIYAFAPPKMRFWERKAKQHDEPIADNSIQTTEVPSAPSQPVDVSLEVTPCGGEDVSLEVRPTVTGKYYGYGWISGTGVTRRSPFDLAWKDWLPSKKTIRGGDIDLIFIATLSPKSRSKLTVRSAANKTVHTDSHWGWWGLKDTHTEWINLRIEIRSDQGDSLWKQEYRFRLSRTEGFEIEEVRDHNPDTVEGTLHETEPVSLLGDLDLRILRFIHHQLEPEGRTFTNRTVWSVLSEGEGAEHCDDRLIILVRDGYISAEVPPNWASLSLGERVYKIHGLTEKGKAAITRKVQG